uniref:Uncharacterized protein n=1 Tax=Heliothis virescens TaxID=7102 RepID=A0A2A4IW23_HELVI
MRTFMILLLLIIAVGDMCVAGAADDIPVTLAGATPADMLLYLYDVVLTPYMLNDDNGEGGALGSQLCRGGKSHTTSGRCPDDLLDDNYDDGDGIL